MSDDLSNIYEEAHKYLWTIAERTGSRNIPSDLREEAVQEGMIRVWRDLDNNETIKLKILRRAGLRVRYHINNFGETPLGKPRLSRSGVAPQEWGASLEKIQIFLNEYLPVHNNVYPTVNTVVDATGISKNTVSSILRKVKSGETNQGVYYTRADGSRVKDRAHYLAVSIEGLFGNTPNGANQNDSTEWTNSNQLDKLHVSWESEYLDRNEMLEGLKKLKPQYRELIYRHFYLGDSFVQLGKELGFTHPSAQASAMIRKGLNQLRNILFPFTGGCNSGHPRTESSTYIYTRSDGAIIRQCIPCHKKNKGADGRYKEHKTLKPVQKSRVKDCAEHGPKKWTDSRGALRCHECKKAAQRRYAAKRKANEG